MNKTFTYIISLFLVFFSTRATQEDLYEKVFGTKQREQAVRLNIFLGQKYLGECDFVLKGTQVMSLDGTCLRNQLLPIFEEDFVSNIAPKNIARTELSKDIKLFYDPSEVKIIIDIPAQFYKLNAKEVYYGPKTFGKKIFRPSKWSHILNYWLQYDFEENDSRGRSNNDYELDLDSSLKFGDLVLENRFELTDDIRKESFTRKRSRLTYDMPKSDLRLSFGDIDTQVLTTQSRLNLLGLSLSKNFALNPYNRITPINEFEFVLERRSFVTIYINDKPVKSEIFEEGRHSIRDLILDFGRSRVKIVAKEVGGDTREFSYQWAGSEELLRVGLSRYSFNLGVKGNYNLEPDYESLDDTILSSFYSQGITKTYTQSFSLQYSDQSLLVGPSLIKATPLGNFRSYLNFSKDKLNEHAGVNSLNEFEFFTQKNARSIRNLITYEYRSPYYASFDTESKRNEYQHILRYDMNWFFNDYINAGVDLERSLSYRSSDFDRQVYGLNLGLRPFRDSSFNVNFRRRKNLNEWDTEFTLFFNMSFSETGHFVSNFYDYENKTNLAQVSYSPLDRQDTFNYFASYDTDPDSKNADLQAGYLSRYFSTDISARLTDTKNDEYEARLRGSIVMTDDFIGLTPYIADSFAYIKGKESLEDKKIGLLTQVGGVLSKEFRNTIYLPTLTSYYLYKVDMDPTHLDFGSSYDFEEFFIAPTLKSVVPVRLGRDKTFVIKGRFISDDHSLKVGNLVSVGGRSFPFFTNRRGEFVVSDVKKGEYEIWLEDKVFSKKVKVDDGNIVINIGDIQ